MAGGRATVSIQFLGAAGMVTGSKHLLKTPEGNFLVDCGLFQGLKALRLKNWDMLPVDVPGIHSVLLTHAHLDHCGYLPLLVRQGFKGKIFCTAPTRDLTEIILRDSARIQEEDAAYTNRKGFGKHQPALPLYTEADVERALPLFVTVQDGETVSLTSNVKAVFRKNGHILGSAFVEFHCLGRRILFSGDVGRPLSALLSPPSTPTPADYIVMESTYGDRLHPATNVLDELADVVVDAIQRKGNLLIPSFAVGRAQELMHLLNVLKKNNRIPDVPVYLDSPMGANATAVLKRHASWHHLTPDQLDALFENVTIISDFSDTLTVADTPGSKIIIAASGMLTGGRVLFYLSKYIEGARNTILLAGYQSEGTRGRSLVDGAHELKIHGAYYKVRAQVRSLSSVSGHADQYEMLNWLGQLPERPAMVFLVHGENGPREAFRVKLETTLNWKVQLPEWSDEAELFTTP
jgi:metallo-beta-lactamase family protein